jgi:hypothetical protein
MMDGWGKAKVMAAKGDDARAAGQLQRA